MSFGTPTFRDIFTSPKMKGATLSLVDIDPENLERMYGLAVKLNEHTGLGAYHRKDWGPQGSTARRRLCHQQSGD